MLLELPVAIATMRRHLLPRDAMSAQQQARCAQSSGYDARAAARSRRQQPPSLDFTILRAPCRPPTIFHSRSIFAAPGAAMLRRAAAYVVMPLRLIVTLRCADMRVARDTMRVKCRATRAEFYAAVMLIRGFACAAAMRCACCRAAELDAMLLLRAADTIC